MLLISTITADGSRVGAGVGGVEVGALVGAEVGSNATVPAASGPLLPNAAANASSSDLVGLNVPVKLSPVVALGALLVNHKLPVLESLPVKKKLWPAELRRVGFPYPIVVIVVPTELYCFANQGKLLFPATSYVNWTYDALGHGMLRKPEVRGIMNSFPGVLLAYVHVVVVMHPLQPFASAL